MNTRHFISRAEKQYDLLIIVPEEWIIGSGGFMQLLKKYMSVNRYDTVLLTAVESCKISNPEQNDSIHYLYISQKEMDKLLKFLSKKVDVMGVLIYDNVRVLSMHFAANNDLNELLKRHLLEERFIIWNRMLNWPGQCYEPLTETTE